MNYTVIIPANIKKLFYFANLFPMQFICLNLYRSDKFTVALSANTHMQQVPNNNNNNKI